MWVLLGDNVAKKILMIMDVGITQLAKKINEVFGNAMWVLQGNNVTKCNLTIMDVKNLGG